MKKPTKPITSPGRSNKYPTPTPMMTSFMRTNVGNKSGGGRLRSTSPMFTRKKNTSFEEPSSPKVTCMGQVRGPTGAAAVHSSRRPGKAKRAGAPAARKKQKNYCGELWRKWVPSFGAVFCYNAKNIIEEDKERRETRIGEEEEASGFGLDDEEEEEEGFERKAMSFCYGNDDVNGSLPPKNALLLTRCSSAPYRSTSLAYRFWGSPNKAQQEEESKTEVEEEERVENGGPTLESEKRSEEEVEALTGILEDSTRERMGKSDEAEGIEDLREVEESSSSAQPLILRRCDSEPTRTMAAAAAAEKLDVDCLSHSHQQVFVIN